MKTLIAVPCMDTVPWQFSQCIVYLAKGEGTTVLYKPNSLVYDSRNLISITAIQQEFDQVLWLDSDVMFPPDTLTALQSDMAGMKDVHMVSGLYVKRKHPTVPVIYDELDEPGIGSDGIPVKHIHEYVDFPRDDLFRVKGCGFGCVLTSVKLLKDVWDNFGPAFNPYPWAGEDISFCHRVNKLGYEIWCDSRVSCGHVGQYVYTENDLKRGDVG